MKLARFTLWLGAVSFFLSGLLYLLFPGFFATRAGVDLGGGGVTDFRATYAGIQIGLSVFLLWCVRDAERIAQGVLCLGCLVATVALVRRHLTVSPRLGSGPPGLCVSRPGLGPDGSRRR